MFGWLRSAGAGIVLTAGMVSGALYAQRFIHGLSAAGVQIHLVVSPLGRRLLRRRSRPVVRQRRTLVELAGMGGRGKRARRLSEEPRHGAGKPRIRGGKIPACARLQRACPEAAAEGPG